MPLDQATLEAQLTAIQAAITTALANPRPNWQVGHVRFDHQNYLKWLYDAQDQLVEQLRSIPSESIDTHENKIDAFGRDGNEYHHEENG
jgi:hypothetical protein